MASAQRGSRSFRGCQQRKEDASVRACDYKFLASAGRTVSSTRPSTQICDSLIHPTQLPPPKLAQIEPFLF
jgi:hypothetical protein